MTGVDKVRILQSLDVTGRNLGERAVKDEDKEGLKNDSQILAIVPFYTMGKSEKLAYLGGVVIELYFGHS